MAKERYALFPVRGILMDPADITLELLNRNWALVSPEPDAIDALVQSPDGFGGNVAMIRDRMKPDAMLIVKCFMEEIDYAGWQRASLKAEQIISALNVMALYKPMYELATGDGRVGVRSLPVPVWVNRVPEHPELPIVFDRERFWMSGHAQPLSWPNTMMMKPFRKRTMADVDAAILGAPTICANLLNGQASGGVESCAHALMLAFNSTTPGQFVSQAVGTLDILFGENDSARWASMETYVSTLCRPAPADLVRNLFKVRHKFTHRHQEPKSPEIHLTTLAVVAASIIHWIEMLDAYGDRAAALDVLEAIGRLERASRTGSQSIADAKNCLLEMRPLPQWVRDWLQPFGSLPD
ncbi:MULTISPECIES: hypothetical protein [unclassified Mesorhizobium]|uniref:hypothetical protein n=1 Tax=unclassified Mesorhizobium TaxID=325217 RepID=UPI0003CF9630|nr:MULTISPECIES: hypothetical protein [unclassified Mesorhizobium]ESY51701.1 hypothetical protein X745_22410 [Mesorhizobium sp. LNJC374B00]WJI78955.1 hypothetical protein NLY34_18950 [Mesorhizobium sp. C374B]WJI85489.1 hypothetical protein NLY42_21350 [Mesorhizobium sp. C372A]